MICKDLYRICGRLSFRISNAKREVGKAKIEIWIMLFATAIWRPN
jgi:hypothetical protein